MIGRAVRVLVIEDNPGDARLLQLTLAAEPLDSYEVTDVPRLGTGVQRLEQGSFDVILLDLGLPDSRGMDGLKRLREKAPNVPVVVLTGAEDPELVRRAIEAGADDYQVKGAFPPGHLGRILRTAIQRRRFEGRVHARQPRDAELLSALSELGEGVAIIDGERVTVVNDAFCEITGWSRAELFVVPAWMSRILRVFARPARTIPGRPAGGLPPMSAAGTFILERKDGLPARVEYVSRTISDGKSQHIVFWLHDARTRGPAGDLSRPGPDSSS